MLIKNEYPRPQFVREQWQNLNGEWEFEFDDNDSGLDDKWYLKKTFDLKINVPFVYQSKLSNIGLREPHDIVWYRRKFMVENRKYGQRTILHFGAVDYEALVFVNGYKAISHKGGHTPFSVDITPFLNDTEQEVTVRVLDSQQDEMLPRGKQFWESESRGIWYTNSTGIWQSVWLENINETHIDHLKFTPKFDDGKVEIKCTSSGKRKDCQLEYAIHFKELKVASGKLDFCSSSIEWDVDLIQEHIFRTNFHDDGWAWTPENPNLFQITVNLLDINGNRLDHIDSYFGFRKIHTEKGMVFLNNKPYYQKLVLDQGYWPDGLLSAPDDDALKNDILLAKNMGFNGCRKHQKMEDPRFLYWADQLGYLVWGECASTPMYGELAVERLMNEWTEIIKRDYNHPCIVVWVPLNESWGVPQIHNSTQQQHFSQSMYHYLHSLDTTRLVISNDGWEMTQTDICAIHNYMHGQKDEEEKFEIYKNSLSTVDKLISCASTAWDIYAKGFSHKGEPILLTEFGGIGFDVSNEKGWGYTSVCNEKEFVEDYGRIMKAVYASEGLWGYCYTQLTDVEQEINGILTYDRKPKCDLREIEKINNSQIKIRLKG